MRRTLFTISLFLMACLAWMCPSGVLAAPHPHPQPKLDTSVQEVRTIGQGRIDAYKDKRDFNYEEQKPTEMTLWDKARWWFWKKIDEAFSNKAVSEGTRWLIWLGTIFVLLYAIFKLVGVDKIRLFVTGGRMPAPAFTTGDDDILTMDLDAEIAAAENAGEHRKAVRLQYLRSLKLLSERGRIAWAPSKTNIDYLSELRGGALETEFRRITRIFEYAWYGEMELSRDQYERAASWFRDFNGSLT